MGENAIGSIQWPAHPRKSPYRRKNLADISYTDRVIAFFVQNFVAMATGVGKNAISSIRWHIPENPPIGAKISHTSRVKANFVPNFVAMATGDRSGKNAIGSIRWPIPENPPINAKISQKSLTQAEL